MIIMGIDPGIATVGYAFISLKGNKLSAVDYGCIRTSKKQIFSQRLVEIYKELKKIIKKYQPDKIAIENLYFAKNVKTAINVGQARGVAVLAAAENKIQIFEFTPLQVKQALTGYGRASKKQVQEMVKAVCNLKTTPRPDDAADALAIAITCIQTKSF
ncbi:crossover junction endodeoxyribonuclease RuvC [Patescibacteria group bacterium]|nr:crossover junction endodeoxyribonuclease RuvC [Patescibacteria group bacterium]